VLSDTHVRQGGKRALPAGAVERLRTADVVLHAGDVVEGWLLDELAELAPVHAVLGNNDVEPRLQASLPERRSLELAGVRIGMVHDSGARTGREARLRRWFPDADVVVFGHSHIPWCARGHGQLLLNPGSPTDKRLQPTHTMATLDLADGKVRKAEIVDLG
jgi:putative phosphoesterase